MNKHKKLALIVAPFLLIGGYVAADYYAAAQARAEMDNKAGRLRNLWITKKYISNTLKFVIFWKNIFF